MFRKICVPIVVLLVIGIYSLAFSAAPSPVPAGQYYITDGSIKVAFKLSLGKKLFDATLNLYDFEVLTDGGLEIGYFDFDGGRFDVYYLGDTLTPVFGGPWTHNGTKVTLQTEVGAASDNLSRQLSALLGLGEGMTLEDLGIQPHFNNSFTGTISKDGNTIKGSFKLVVTFDVEGLGSIPGTSLTISGTYVANSAPTGLAASHVRTVYATQGELTKKEIAAKFGQAIRANILNMLNK
jgi:hypothetical protein